MRRRVPFSPCADSLPSSFSFLSDDDSSPARHRAAADHEKKETPASERASERPFGGILTRTHQAGKGGDPPHRCLKQDGLDPPFNLRAKRECKSKEAVSFSQGMSIYSLMARNCTHRYSPSTSCHKICEDLLLPKLCGNDRSRAGYSTDADWKFAALLRRIADLANAVTLFPRFHRSMK